MTGADDGDGGDVVVCHVYTHARRHPIVIGNIQGLRIPPATPAQLGVFTVGLLGLAVTRSVWAHLGLANAVVMFGVPVGLAWLVRSTRFEGRAPWRAAIGWLSLLAAPRQGVWLGRSAKATSRRVRYGPTWCSGGQRGVSG